MNHPPNRPKPHFAGYNPGHIPHPHTHPGLRINDWSGASKTDIPGNPHVPEPGRISPFKAEKAPSSTKAEAQTQFIPRQVPPGFPNPGFPNTGFPNTGFPNTGFPNTGFPNTGFSNPGLPQYGFPGYAPTPNNIVPPPPPSAWGGPGAATPYATAHNPYDATALKEAYNQMKLRHQHEEKAMKWAMNRAGIASELTTDDDSASTQADESSRISDDSSSSA